MVQHKRGGEQSRCWFSWAFGPQPWMGRLRLLGHLGQRPLRLWGCIHRYIRSSKRKSDHGMLRAHAYCRLRLFGLDFMSWAQGLLISMILVCLIDTRSILDGILAIQNRMYPQRNTSGGLGHYRINHRWTKYGTVQAYPF